MRMIFPFLPYEQALAVARLSIARYQIVVKN
jgi:hypothetical protein